MKQNESWLSGWLSPEGVFTAAAYDKYDEIAIELERTDRIKPIYDNVIRYAHIHGEKLLELSGYIKFVYRQLGKSSYDTYVIFPQLTGVNKDVTDKQIDWLEANYYKMSSLQRDFIIAYLYESYNRKRVFVANR